MTRAATGIGTASQADTRATADAPLQARVDIERLERNLTRFHHAAHTRGLRVRSHVKGHRTVQIALRQARAGACGIAVNHVAQARRYVAAGLTDVVIAHPWPEPWRWRLIAGLARDCRVSAHVTSPEAVDGLAAAAAATGTEVGVRVQLGTGYDVEATPDEDLLALAHLAARQPTLRFDGITAYQGMVTEESARDRRAIGRATAQYAVHVAELLRASGLPCPAVTVGGTPTAPGAMDVAGVTELCAGAYALLDAGMAGIGVCDREDVALSVAVCRPDEAETILAAHPYPWQTPGERTRRSDRDSELLPPHICPLLPQIDSVTAYEGGRHRGVWRVLNETDGETNTDTGIGTNTGSATGTAPEPLSE